MSVTLCESPSVVIDGIRLEANLLRMQEAADRNDVELWPHIKTHRMEALGRRQLELGAHGFTCAKLSEAEALLGTGVRRVFIAHSLATKEAVQRLCELTDQLDEVTIGVTSLNHFACLEHFLNGTGRIFRVALAVDTGLGREGVRDVETAKELASKINSSSSMRLVAIYTHEGHAYGQSSDVIAQLLRLHTRN